MRDPHPGRGGPNFFFDLMGLPSQAFQTEGEFVFHGAVEELSVRILEHQAHRFKKVGNGQFPGVPTQNGNPALKGAAEKMGDQAV